MKKAFLLPWVFMMSLGLLSANDQKDLAGRQMEVQRMSKEFSQHAEELEKMSQKVEGEVAGEIAALAKLRKTEAESLKDLAAAQEKKQWSSIKRYEKKSAELCGEFDEKMNRFIKKFGGRPFEVVNKETNKEAHSDKAQWEAKNEAHPDKAQKEKMERQKAERMAKKNGTDAQPSGDGRPVAGVEPKPGPETTQAAPAAEAQPQPDFEKINAQAQGLGNP